MWYKTFKLIKTHLNSHVLHFLIVLPLMACMEGYLITQTTFLHFSLSNESSRCLQKWTKNRAGCNYLAFLRCGFSKVSSRHFDQSTNSHTVKLHLFGFLSNVRIQICPQLWLAGQNENFIYLTFVVGVHIKQQVLRPIPMHLLAAWID